MAVPHRCYRSQIVPILGLGAPNCALLSELKKRRFDFSVLPMCGY
jgi:hypothetical protein